jgi:hypothetical protein
VKVLPHSADADASRHPGELGGHDPDGEYGRQPPD